MIFSPFRMGLFFKRAQNNARFTAFGYVRLMMKILISYYYFFSHSKIVKYRF